MTIAAPPPLGFVPVLVVGAGAWGTAVAIHFAKRAPKHGVMLWGRDPAQMAQMQAVRQNKTYLPGPAFPDAMVVSSDLVAACAHWRLQTDGHRKEFPGQSIHGLIVLAAPMSGLAETAAQIREILGKPLGGEGLLWLAKGLRLGGPLASANAHELHWPHEIVAEASPGWPAGALSGPSFAQEVAAGLPVGLTLASHDLGWARQVAQSCHGGGMRIYATEDLIGVELGGAMKNVLAIAAGVCDGLALGANARAALLTRGLAEMARLGVAIGAKPKTFMGLATLGDLILTATGDLSRNRRVGLALAKGQSLDDVVRSLGHVAEGVATAPALLRLAQQASVDVPITESVCRLITGQWTAQQAISELMSRNPKDEHDD
jgi:glycerol-3-phosphate dehydrogenase (NAD(P)+)